MDHGKKGKRAGFKFDDETVGYNCFNCGHSAIYDPREHGASIPRNMITVLDAFGVHQTEWEQATFDVFMADRTLEERKQREIVSINPQEIQLPDTFYRLDDNFDEWCLHAIDYLESRLIKWDDHPYFLSKPTKDPALKKWYGRLIIPVYKDGKLIFWQGRDLTDTMIKKYLSVDSPRDKILYGFDQLMRYTEEPLYIMEGFFDAHLLNGVATFGNKLTPEQIEWINRSTRPKVYIPDKFGDGHIAALQAIEQGWSVSLPDWGAETKDVTDSFKRYGELFTRMAIKRGTIEGFAAEVEIGLYCVKSDRSTRK